MNRVEISFGKGYPGSVAGGGNVSRPLQHCALVWDGFLLQRVLIAFEAPVPLPHPDPSESFCLFFGLLEQEWDKNSHFAALCSFCRFWSMCKKE